MLHKLSLFSSINLEKSNLLSAQQMQMVVAGGTAIWKVLIMMKLAAMKCGKGSVLPHWGDWSGIS